MYPGCELLCGIFANLDIPDREGEGQVFADVENLTLGVMGRFDETREEDAGGPFVPPTEEEYEEVVYPAAVISIKGAVGCVGEGESAPPGWPHPPVSVATSRPGGFTLRDMFAAVEMVEREMRGSSVWFGGVDVHHVSFAGMCLGGWSSPPGHGGEGDAWEICWDS
jgi:hypothetical protein